MDVLEQGFSNEELLQSAFSDEPAEVEQTETPEVADDRPRDEHGRFVAKVEEPEQPEPEVKAVEKPAEEGQIPSWRLRELREERDELRRQLAEATRRQVQPQEQQKKPDLFENPDGFLKAGVSEAIDPIRQEVETIREFYSRKDAIREHGEERVVEAFTALDRAAKLGDPIAMATVQAVKKSPDPFAEIVAWHTRNVVASNPDAFAQKWLEDKLKDEKFVAELVSKIKPAQEEKPRPVINVPPSLNRATAAQAAIEEGGDFSNESLLAYAMR